MGKKKDSQGSILLSLNILVAITTAVFAILSATDKNFEFIRDWYVIVGILTIYLFINWIRVYNYVKKILSEIYFFLSIQVQYRRGHLEFLDKYGKEAMFNEECLLRKIKRKRAYEGVLTAEGSIMEEINTYNCFSRLNHKKDKVTIMYGKKEKSKDRIMNHRQLQFGFAITFLNTFTNKEEFWETTFKHPTKFYDLKISFHKKNPPTKADIYRVTRNKDGSEVLESLSIDPLIIKKYNRVVMKVKLLHVQKDDCIRVTWEWSQQNTPPVNGGVANNVA